MRGCSPLAAPFESQYPRDRTEPDECEILRLLIATKRMFGRPTASQIASASLASFLPRFQ
jgi:hypothetical protein